MVAAKHLSESCFLPSACIAGLSPSLKGNRDFLRFRTHARDQTDSELSAVLEPMAAGVSKNKNGADVFLARPVTKDDAFSFLGSSRPQLGLKSDGLLASLLVKRQRHWGAACNP
jgi:hypothetical protein